MNTIDDARIAFYLKHQAQIDEWAELGKRVPELANAFLESCLSDVEALKPDLQADDIRTYEAEGEYSKVFLARSGWWAAGASDTDSPRAAIGIEWHRTKLLRFAGAPNCAYAGVWVKVSAEGGADLSKRIQKFIKPLASKHHLAGHQWWPAYRYVGAEGEYWSDLHAYRAKLVSNVAFFWTTFAREIDEAMASSG